MPYPDAASHPPRPHFRTLRDASRILVERRPETIADQDRHPRVVDTMAPRERELFYAQLHAYEAAVAYVHSIDAFREIWQYEKDGFLSEMHRTRLFEAHLAEWLAARDRWRFLRDQSAR